MIRPHRNFSRTRICFGSGQAPDLRQAAMKMQTADPSISCIHNAFLAFLDRLFVYAHRIPRPVCSSHRRHSQRNYRRHARCPPLSPRHAKNHEVLWTERNVERRPATPFLGRLTMWAMADFIPHVANLSERQKVPPLPFATIPFPRDRDFDRDFDRGDIPDCNDKRCSESAVRVPCAVWASHTGCHICWSGSLCGSTADRWWLSTALGTEVFYYRTVTALATRATGGRSQHTYYPLNGSIIASIWDGFPNGNITVETYGGSCRSIGNPSTQRALWAVEGICCGDDWIKRKLGAGLSWFHLERQGRHLLP